MATTSVRPETRTGVDLVGGRSVAKLAVIVISPGPDSAVAFQGDYCVQYPPAMATTSVRPETCTGTDLSVARAVAELAIIVVSPRPSGAVAFQGNAVEFSPGDGDDIGEARNLYGG